jgi:NAD-dependent dihydropyrimidine dehydrogenase PreA subunit
MKTAEGYNADPVHVELAEMFSSVKIMGPPMSEMLVALISHIFTPEEAGVCLNMSFVYPKTVEQIARRSGRRPGELEPVLEAMSRKQVIVALAQRFMLYPLLPGLFEHIMRTGEKSAWHHTYAELINELFDTGYLREYFSRPVNAIRNIPVQQAVRNKSFIADADLVSELIDSHHSFAVYHTCPCRQSMHLTGHECGRASPHDGCLAFGDFTRGVVADGNGRSVSKGEMYDIVAERWEKNLVFLTSNVTPSVQTAICTCCGCCCRALGIFNKFSKNLLAPSHFIAAVDESRCTNCGSCVPACNTLAHHVVDKMHVYNPANCIGCGSCVAACANEAISMTENRLYKPPRASYTSLILQMIPPVILMGTKIKLARYFSKT